MQILIKLVDKSGNKEDKNFTLLWSDVAFIPFRYGDYIDDLEVRYKIEDLVWVAPKNPESESWTYVIVAYRL